MVSFMVVCATWHCHILWQSKSKPSVLWILGLYSSGLTIVRKMFCTHCVKTVQGLYSDCFWQPVFAMLSLYRAEWIFLLATFIIVLRLRAVSKPLFKITSKATTLRFKHHHFLPRFSSLPLSISTGTEQNSKKVFCSAVHLHWEKKESKFLKRIRNPTHMLLIWFGNQNLFESSEAIEYSRAKI